MATRAEQLGKFEPAVQNRFRIYFDEVGGSPLSGREECEICVQSSDLPKRSLEEIEVPVGTEVIYYGGRRKVEPLNVVFRDMFNSAAFSFLQNWSQRGHNESTGRRGYKSEYAGTARLQLLGVDDEVVREWKLINIWIQNFNPGQVDETSNDIVTIEIAFRYDKAIPTTY